MTGWFAFACLTVWAAAYLRNVATFLTAPGVPATFVLATEAGPLTFTVDSYTVDPDQRFLDARGAKVSDASGRLLFRAEGVQATFRAEGFQLAGAQVRLRDGYVFVERLADGQFAVQRFLPPPTDEPPPEQGFSVDVSNFVLEYLDQTGVQDVRQEIQLDALRLDAFGDDLVATLRALPDQGGAIEGVLTRTAAGELGFRGRLTAIDPFALLDRARPIREIAEVEELNLVWGAQAVLNGGLILSVPVDEPVRFQFDGTLRAPTAGYDAYRFRDVAFEGRLTQGGISGRILGAAEGLTARFVGEANWQEAFSLQGDADASLSDTRLAPRWLAALLPDDVAASGATFAGWVGVRKEGVSAHGPVTVKELQWQDYAVTGLSTELSLSPETTRFDDLTAVYRGEEISGNGAFGLKDQELLGIFRARDVDFVRFFEDPRLKGAEAKGDVVAALTGTVAEPEVAFRARGSAVVPVKEGTAIPVDWDADAQYRGDRLTVHSVLVEGAEGAAVASGWWDIKSDRMEGTLVAKGLELESLNADVEGTVFTTAQFSGTLAKPEYRGRLESYGVRTPDFEFPIAATNFAGDLDRVMLSDVVVAKGASRLTGEGSYTFVSEAIEGAFAVSTVQLSDWVREGPVGIFDVTDGQVSGTLAHPVASARFESSRLIYKDFAIDSVRGEVALQGKVIEATNVEIEDNRGRILVDATYDLESKTGFATGGIDSLAVSDVVPESFTDVLLFGVLGGTFQVSINAENQPTGLAELTIWRLGVNDAVVGDGTMVVTMSGGVIEAEAKVGSSERYVALERGRYDLTDGYFDASFLAERMPISELTPALLLYMDTEDIEGRTRLAALEGSLDLDIRVVGSGEDFYARLEVATVDDLRFEGIELGKVELAGGYAGKSFELESMDWNSDRGRLTIRRNRLDTGDVLDGELVDFDASNFGLINRDMSGLRGRVQASFLVSDPDTSPVIRASVTSSSVEVQGEAGVSDLNLFDILIREGEARLEGGFVYRGFRGTVSAQAPLKYPLSIPEDEPLIAVVRLPERPLAELVDLLPTLDPEGTDGRVSGEFRISGTLNQLVADGHAEIQADRVMLTTQRAAYQNVALRANYENDKVTLSGSAETSAGGSASLSGQATVPEMREILEFGPDRLLASRLSALLKFDQFNIDESFGRGGEIRGVVVGEVSAEGPARAPVIAGRLSVVDGFVTVPQPEDGGGPREPSDFNPTFDIRVTTDTPIRIGANIATIDLSGVVALGGTFNRPVATANLETTGGTIRLPLARVQVTPGGTVRFVFQGESSGYASQRLDVDIDGTTRITAVPYANLVQRYTVFVNLRGNMLEDGGLVIRAYSEPPDLSQARILSLIGYGDLFGDTGNTETTGLESRLRQAATSIAIPALFDPVAEQIAKQLGLDFVGADYNAIDGASIIAAKSFGRGFSLQASRQLFQPAFGPTKYDLRFQYRVPVRGLPGALSFSIGTDQERPWKISVDYSFRF